MALRQRWTSRAKRRSLDGVLVQWGDRLFYPGNRMVKRTPEPRLSGFGWGRAAIIRERIGATVVRRAMQVMVKVTGGGRGMKAIAAHFRYISKNGRLEIEDERDQLGLGKETVRELVDDWRLGGSLVADVSDRREAFNIMLSMPRGIDALTVQRAPGSSRNPSLPTTSTSWCCTTTSPIRMFT